MLRQDAGVPFKDAGVIELLDAFRAAERAGADALGRWLTACADPRLRGGLRVIRARDERHAALVERRLRALGGAPSATVSRELATLCDVVADPTVPDRTKLALLLARFPVPGVAPLVELVRRVVGDDETRALLVAIDDDERASVEWLRRMRDLLEGEEPA